MVRSRLNPNVNYKELKKVNYNDIDDITCIWNLYKFDKLFNITLRILH